MSDQPSSVTSRIPGFYRERIEERLRTMIETGLLSEKSAQHLRDGGRLTLEVADRMSENVIAVHGLPLSIALNFRVNHRDVLVPMAVEEPSVVAAASNAARQVRMTGGFFGEATAPIMTTQVQFDDVPNPHEAKARVEAERERIFKVADEAIPGMVKRGGGCRDMDVRILDEEHGVLVVHLYVDVGDAMGANVVDAVAEAVAPEIREFTGGTIGLRILSNLPIRRRVRLHCEVSADVLGGPDLAEGIVKASRFAELDPYRAVTHNKGVMNGVDAVALAMGQDWRSIEAGAHAFAAVTGTYKPLVVWRRTESGIRGELDMPLAVGIVGGSTRVHRGVRAGFELMGVTSAGELAIVMAAAGMASNLAALRALAGEGIQRGHMRLHSRKQEVQENARLQAKAVERGGQ
ncbi:MAG: hydroxymethylglutaryl-CoA reductase, degradative [Myxococcales bacterium]|nr:hydroxymethylglutaryl-CoA reductase, degradative [Myxococcales bacterium]MDH3845183.1 hydroxymethylglutaryl-CoA reductase, degradative [Myxococcales bacterium]